MALKLARIVVLGHNLFLEAHGFPGASLLENCSHIGTDNVRGQISVRKETDSIIFLQIVKSGKFSHFVDGHEESQSNWMRFVNCSRCEDEQNIVAFQFRGEIYYRTYKSINPGEELLVWYGESYARDLGISLVDDPDLGSKKSMLKK